MLPEGVIKVFTVLNSEKATLIYSRASAYGFRALNHLALHPARPIPANKIAETAGVPPHFLAKILQQLARAGLLKSYRGPRGGFLLGRASEEITLLDIVDGPRGGHAVQALCRWIGPVLG